MLNYIHEMPNPIADEFNRDFLDGTLDTPIEDFVMMVMQDFESVENIEILSVETIWDMDEIDYNRHTININYKRKNLAAIEIPTNKFVAASRYFEMIFKIKITTNLNSQLHQSLASHILHAARSGDFQEPDAGHHLSDAQSSDDRYHRHQLGLHFLLLCDGYENPSPRS